MGIDLFYKNFKLYSISIICSISFVLLTITSPILSLLWLLVPTGYFLYHRNYKNIAKIWGFTLSTWYFIFTISLSEVPILIGFEHTRVLAEYMFTQDFIFPTLCFQTLAILNILSAKLGFPLYIPNISSLFS
jgi:hypothetical protein